MWEMLCDGSLRQRMVWQLAGGFARSSPSRRVDILDACEGQSLDRNNDGARLVSGYDVVGCSAANYELLSLTKALCRLLNGYDDVGGDQ